MGPGHGRYTWRDRYADPALEVQANDYRAAPEKWPPLTAGICGGDPARADVAWSQLEEWTANVRKSQRFA